MPRWPAALVLLAAVPLAAQAVHQVGPGGFPTIQAAVDAAADGDVIRIAPGNYTIVRTTKGLRFVGGPGVNVQQFDIRLQPGQHTVISGVDLPPTSFLNSFLAWGGTLTLEDCAMTTQGGLNLQRATVVMRHCRLVSQLGDCCYVQEGHLSATDCTFAVQLPLPLRPVTATVRAALSTLQLARCRLTGADAPANPQFVAAPALWFDHYFYTHAGEAWLSDCTLLGGNSANNNPAAPAVLARAPVHVQRCTLAGGTDLGGQVPPTSGTVLAGPLLSSGSSPAAVVPGGTMQLAFTGDPAHVLFVLAAFEIGAPQAVPALAQPSLLDPPAGLPIGLLVTDAQGAAAMPLPIPNNPALQNLAVWLRGVDAFTVPLQASPVLGVLIR